MSTKVTVTGRSCLIQVGFKSFVTPSPCVTRPTSRTMSESRGSLSFKFILVSRWFGFAEVGKFGSGVVRRLEARPFHGLLESEDGRSSRLF
jgi:hypothetical protein